MAFTFTYVPNGGFRGFIVLDDDYSIFNNSIAITVTGMTLCYMLYGIIIKKLS